MSVFPHVQGPAPTPACLPCNEVEFYDEDEDVSGYEDNIYVFDNFDCETFKDSWLKIAKLMRGAAFLHDLHIKSPNSERRQQRLATASERKGCDVLAAVPVRSSQGGPEDHREGTRSSRSLVMLNW